MMSPNRPGLKLPGLIGIKPKPVAIRPKQVAVSIVVDIQPDERSLFRNIESLLGGDVDKLPRRVSVYELPGAGDE